MPSKAEIKPISPCPGWEHFSINLDLDTVADAPTLLRNIRNVINKSKVGRAEISLIPHPSPPMSGDENVNRVVECIRNDSEKVFSRQVFIAIRDGHEDIALNIIRKVVPDVAKQIRVELSSEDQEKVAQIILERARKIQQQGEWEGTLKWLVERKRGG